MLLNKISLIIFVIFILPAYLNADTLHRTHRGQCEKNPVGIYVGVSNLTGISEESEMIFKKMNIYDNGGIAPYNTYSQTKNITIAPAGTKSNSLSAKDTSGNYDMSGMNIATQRQSTINGSVSVGLAIKNTLALEIEGGFLLPFKMLKGSSRMPANPAGDVSIDFYDTNTTNPSNYLINKIAADATMSGNGDNIETSFTRDLAKISIPYGLANITTYIPLSRSGQARLFVSAGLGIANVKLNFQENDITGELRETVVSASGDSSSAIQPIVVNKPETFQDANLSHQMPYKTLLKAEDYASKNILVRQLGCGISIRVDPLNIGVGYRMLTPMSNILGTEEKDDKTINRDNSIDYKIVNHSAVAFLQFYII